jgi:hypothetical protein
MPRSKITSQSKDLITDDGSILASVVEGEQVRLNITVGWVTNLTGYTITAKIDEGENTQGAGTVPTDPLSGGVVTTLTIIDSDTTDNSFDIVIPEDLIDTWATSPEVDNPVYGFFGLEIRDTGTGDNQMIWKPMRGLVQVRYSPTEAS